MAEVKEAAKYNELNDSFDFDEVCWICTCVRILVDPRLV